MNKSLPRTGIQLVRGSFHHRVYVDLVCWLKQMIGRDLAISITADQRKMRRDQVACIYNRYIRSQLRQHNDVSRLV